MGCIAIWSVLLQQNLFSIWLQIWAKRKVYVSQGNTPWFSSISRRMTTRQLICSILFGVFEVILLIDYIYCTYYDLFEKKKRLEEANQAYSNSYTFACIPQYKVNVFLPFCLPLPLYFPNSLLEYTVRRSEQASNFRLFFRMKVYDQNQ